MRTTTSLLATGLLAAALTLPSAAAHAAPTTDPGAAAAGFVGRALDAGGDRFLSWYDANSDGVVDPGEVSDAFGPTIDGVLALAATGLDQDQADASTQYVAANLPAYVGAGTDVYAASTAKALYLTQVQGEDPSSFGGLDLVARLQAQEDAGWYRDTSGFGDYSNTIGQSFGVLGLAREGTGPSADAVQALRDQQCADGSFRLDPDDATCVGTADPTAYAVQALIEVAGVADPDVVAGLDYLAATQGGDGGFGGNANATGLAAQALAAGGRAVDAEQARTFVLSLQYGCAFPAALQGGVAVDATTLSDRQAEGAGAVADVSDHLATSQALLGLAGTPLGDLVASGSSVDAPTLQCAAPTPPTTDPVEPTDPPAVTPPAPAEPAPAAAPVRTGARAELAATGGTPQQGALVGLGLIALGAAAVVVASQRGARGRSL